MLKTIGVAFALPGVCLSRLNLERRPVRAAHVSGGGGIGLFGSALVDSMGSVVLAAA